MSRPRRPPRMAWFAFDVDSFLENPKMRRLTPREQSFWALMLIKSFRLQGEIYATDETVAAETGATIKEASALLHKLIESGLLKQTRGLEYISERMRDEHAKAQAAYTRYSTMGKESSQKNGTGNLRVIK